MLFGYWPCPALAAAKVLGHTMVARGNITAIPSGEFEAAVAPVHTMLPQVQRETGGGGKGV